MMQPSAVGTYATGDIVGMSALPLHTPAYPPSMAPHGSTTQTISAPLTITINGDVNGIDDFERTMGDVTTRVIVPELQ